MNIFAVSLYAMHVQKAGNVGPGGYASLLRSPDPGGVLNYGTHKTSIHLKTSLTPKGLFRKTVFVARFRQCPIASEEGTR